MTGSRLDRRRYEGSLLEVKDVTLQFGGVTALRNVSFDVEENELFAVIGPNGAGKTSIFNCLNGVYRPQEGSIRFQGLELVGRRPTAIAQLGMARTFQNLGLFVNLNVIDNLMLGRHVRMRSGLLSGMAWIGRARREEIANRRRVEEIMELLALQPFRYEPVGSLPYGIQKKIELGRALAMDPRILLLD
ncbi:MAG TPA: ATP-binding cassette domain-containing protein, partial [Gaiellaceae bacterium]|nr:ATP-binding cassette domain-containing protein [Gaiellaceae bacterium]